MSVCLRFSLKCVIPSHYYERLSLQCAFKSYVQLGMLQVSYKEINVYILLSASTEETRTAPAVAVA